MTNEKIKTTREIQDLILFDNYNNIVNDEDKKWIPLTNHKKEIEELKESRDGWKKLRETLDILYDDLKKDNNNLKFQLQKVEKDKDWAFTQIKLRKHQLQTQRDD